MAVAPVKPLLRLPRVRNDVVGLLADSECDGAAQTRAVSIVPGGLDENAADVCVTSFGHRAPAFGGTRGVLAGHQAHVGPQLARGTEAVAVDELGEQDHGAEGVDPAETAEPAHRLAVRVARRERVDLAVEFGAPRLRLLDGEQRGVAGALQLGLLEALGAEPGPMRLAPVGARPIPPTVAEQELDEPMTPAEDIFSDVVPAAKEIADACLGFRRDVNGGEFASPVEPNELGRVAPIGLDALARAARCQGRRDHVAMNAQGRHLPVERVARPPRLIANPDRPLAADPLEQPTKDVGVVRDLSPLGRVLAGPQDSGDDCLLAVIERYVCSTLSHDRSPFACGSVLSGTIHVYAIGRPVLPYGLKTALWATIPAVDPGLGNQI